MNIVRLKNQAERSVDELKEVIAKDGEIKSLVVIVGRGDDTYDVWWSRQQLSNLAYCGRRLEQEIRWLMDGVTELGGG